MLYIEQDGTYVVYGCTAVWVEKDSIVGMSTPSGKIILKTYASENAAQTAFTTFVSNASLTSINTL